MHSVINVYFLFIVRHWCPGVNAYSTYYIDLIDSSNKTSTNSLYQQVISSINAQLAADGSLLTLRLRNISKPNEVYNDAYDLVKTNVIALLDLNRDHHQTGCIISTITEIPVFGVNDQKRNQMKTLKFCKRFITISADYSDYSRASIQILDTFQWKKVALVFEDNRFYQAAFFQSITAKKSYSLSYIQLTSQSNQTIYTTAKQIFSQLARLDVDVILLYANDNLKFELLNQEPCNPTKSYVWIIQESIPKSIKSESSHMVVGFHLPRNNALLAKSLHAVNVTYQEGIHLIFDSTTAIKMTVAQLQTQKLWLPGNSSDDVLKNRKLLYEHVRKIVFQGQTGQVKFDDACNRIVEELDIDNLRSHQFVRIGTWSKSSSKLQLDPDGEIKQNIHKQTKAHSLQGKKLAITSVKLAPFHIQKTLPGGRIEYSGFCIELLKQLASDLKFSYTIHESYDGNYGSFMNGEWNGMVRELIDGKADMAVSDLTITEERESAIDFTSSIMYYTEDMTMRKTEIPRNDFLQFMAPFSIYVWTIVLVIVLVFTLMLYAFNYFSPYGWKNEQGTKTSEEFSLFNCLWFSVACMLQQGADNTPKSMSGRLLAGFFWFYVLIWVSTYTANLAAFFTVNLKELPINSFEEAINTTEYELGISKKSHLVDYFNSSKVALYQKTWKRMKKLPHNNSEGIQWARDENKKYIHIGNGPYLEYEAGKEPCNLVIIPGLASPKSYAFALTNNNPYIDELNLAILHLHENGYIQKLRRKYWNIEKQCTTDISKLKYPRIIGRTPVSLQSMAGVFIVLAVGFVLSLIILAIEVYWYQVRVVKKNAKALFKKPAREITGMAKDNLAVTDLET